MEGWKQWYDDVVTEHRDPRTVGWFGVGSPFEGILICLVYVLIVTKIGPALMKNREPMNLRNWMVGYNLAMVVLSAYMMYLFLMGGWLKTYTLGCQLMDTSSSPEATTMVWACYVFYLSKYVELADTIFFVLRKKFHLITVLHVFHHAIMPCSWWIAVKFSPGGMGSFHALCNAFVHVLMYGYYGIAAMGPQYQKYLWWKKYMTKIQIIQFIAVAVHSCQTFFTDCTYPKLFSVWILLYAIIFLTLFANFYIQAYFKRRHDKAAAKQMKNGTQENGHHVTSNGDHNANGLKRD